MWLRLLYVAPSSGMRRQVRHGCCVCTCRAGLQVVLRLGRTCGLTLGSPQMPRVLLERTCSGEQRDSASMLQTPDPRAGSKTDT